MSERAVEKEVADDRIPWQQKVMDNLWILLALGVLIPAGIYLLWGLWELANVPLWGGR